MKKNYLLLLLGFLLVGCNSTPISTSSKLIDVIYVETDPDKMIYLVGETFDPTGMVVNAYYQDESEGMITGWEYDNHDPLDNGEAKSATVTIIITYGEYETDLDITVVDSLEGIGQINGLVPVTKPLVQKVGNSFDSTGCTFHVLFDGQESEKVYKYGEYINGNSYNQIKVSSSAKITSDQKEVMINYSQGQEYALKIAVADKINVTNSVTSYVANTEEFKLSTLTVTPNIVNGASAEEYTLNLSSLSFVDNIEGNIKEGHKFQINGEHTISARYGAFDISFKVNVTGGQAEIEPEQNLNPDQQVIEFEDNTQVELIDNTPEKDTLGATANYTGSYQDLVRDLVTYPGEYAPSNGDFVRCVQPTDSFKLTFKSFGGKANLILRGATNNATPAEYIARETLLKNTLTMTLNGKEINVGENKFNGKQGKDETIDKGGQFTGRYMYCVWTDINLGEVSLRNGINEIQITIKDTATHPGHYDCVTLDYAPFKDRFVANGDTIKVEAEDFSLVRANVDAGVKVSEDALQYYPNAKSSGGKYLADVSEGDKISTTFNANSDGVVNFNIIAASNSTDITNTSTPPKSYDMYLKDVMKVYINEVNKKVNDNAKFTGTTHEAMGEGSRVYANYTSAHVLSFEVQKGYSYEIVLEFAAQNDVKHHHSYGGTAFGNYDYVTFEVGTYESEAK